MDNEYSQRLALVMPILADQLGVEIHDFVERAQQVQEFDDMADSDKKLVEQAEKSINEKRRKQGETRIVLTKEGKRMEIGTKFVKGRKRITL